MIPEIPSLATLHADDFDYHLPQEQIAIEPKPDRDSSKLLIYKDDKIVEDAYRNIVNFLNVDHFLVFNNSRVVQARLQFDRGVGKKIEIFCLEPADKSVDMTLALQKPNQVEWRCFVGNLKKWKEKVLSMQVPLEDRFFVLSAELLEKEYDSWIVKLSWDNENLVFADVLEAAGKIPLPPYIEREAQDDDKITYQTIYAKDRGSVAAPTAGLHFTQGIFERLKTKGIDYDYLTLHVGAGTFKPVKNTLIKEHLMHDEQVLIDIHFLEKLIRKVQQGTKIVAVGTTSARFLESIYWMGCKLASGTNPSTLDLGQWESYFLPNLTIDDSLNNLLKFFVRHKIEKLQARTSIMIVPGYNWKMVDKLITNFHQPKSTLIMLVSSFIGGNWKVVYDYALKNDFRFLSYGDGCLLERG
jgi:S-adenosylmethionine:tRNA ribosyltransferase-isomerase